MMNVADLQPYPDYKESGLPWLGQIPSHWSTERAKWLFTKMSRPVRPEDEVVTCFRDGMVTLRKNRRLTGYTEATVEIGYQGIRKGDLVIHGMDAFAGAMGVSDSDGKSTPVYNVCKPQPGINAHYYALVLRRMAQAQWLLALAKGIRERSSDFRYETFGNQRLPIPPLEEQEGIVRFLGWANGRIERTIRLKRRTIALLNEQKQAIIHRAVTRGLDADAPLRPSGIPWLGDIPAHWEVRRLRASITDSVNGIWGAEPNGKDDLICVRVADFDRANLRVSLKKKTVRAIPQSARSRRLLRKGDLLLEKSGGGDLQPVGVVVIYDHDEPAVCSNFIAKMSIAEGYNSFFLCYLHSILYSYRVNTRSIKQTTGIQNLDDKSYLSEYVAFPPMLDQEAIVDYISTQTQPIGVAISRFEREIELLQEYRTCLVADVVTGKLDVRPALPHLPPAGAEPPTAAEPEEEEDTADDDL